VGDEAVAEDEQSLLFALELFSSAANQEGSNQKYRGVLGSLLRHCEKEGVSLCSELQSPQLYSYQASLAYLA
jgi:hypothetical protein